MRRWWRRRKAQKTGRKVQQIESQIRDLQAIYERAVTSHAPRAHIHRQMVRLRAEQMRLEA